jgi:hypothetical protein
LGINRAYFHLETLQLQDVFLSKTKGILKDNNVLDAPATNTDGFLHDIHVFFSLAE